MQLFKTTILLLVFSSLTALSQVTERNILTREVIASGSIDQLVQLSPDKAHILPVIHQRDAWQQVLPETAKQYIDKAESYLNYNWPTLRLTDFLAYERTGSRIAYEDEFFHRRRILNILAVAECIENKGRFLDALTDGIWAILSEPSWVVPAHNWLKGTAFSPLPYPGLYTLDLFSAETGSTLSLIMQMLGDSLEHNAPGITSWVNDAVTKRLLQPLYERNDWWWMGFVNAEHHHINNWNPWINSNLLKCILLTESDTAKRRQGIETLLKSLDNYMNRYPDDGGCDEGPSYWNHAAGTLFDALYTMYTVTEGRINLFNEELVQNMGSYIYKVHIYNNWMINFADASAKGHFSAPYTVYGYGKYCGDTTLMQYGAYLALKESNDPAIGRSYQTQRMVMSLLHEQEMLNAKAHEPFVDHAWFPSIELFVAREKAGSSAGFFLGAKGGHNNESHNHNDVGTFVVFLDGKPLIIDAGAAVYTKYTFSDKRYTLWNNQSAYHNLPTINGTMQQAGNTFCANEVHVNFTDQEALFSMDLQKAYPDSAAIINWKRTLKLEKGKALTWTEDFALQGIHDTTTLHIMLAYPPEIKNNGIILLSNGDKKITLSYDKKLLTVTTDQVDLSYDNRLSANWGALIYRLNFQLMPSVQRGSLAFSLTQ